LDTAISLGVFVQDAVGWILGILVTVPVGISVGATVGFVEATVGTVVGATVGLGEATVVRD